MTGMAGRLGRRLVRRLHRKTRVLGLGARAPRGLPVDVQHHTIDPQRSAARRAFAEPSVSAIVHLGVVHNPHAKRGPALSENLLSFQRIVEYAAHYQISKIVLLSSANTYGPRSDNAQFLNEQAPLLASGSFSAMQPMVELDMYAQSCFWRHPEIELVILRPTHILGTVRNAPSNYLRLPVVPTLLGFDPMMQAVHQEDVVDAIELALRPGVQGIFNLAGPSPIPLSKGLEILGRRQVPIPHSLARGGLAGMFRLGMSNFPPPQLDFIRYVCMVDDAAARRELGYSSRHGIEETLRAVDQERWVSPAGESA